MHVKGADCFDKVLDNLRNYAAAGEVVLKYILLEDVNDEEEDFAGFIQFAQEINARVVISRDCRIVHLHMSENEHKMHRKFMELCHQSNISYALIKEYINADDMKRLKEDALMATDADGCS